jgi:hypothetical protein
LWVLRKGGILGINEMYRAEKFHLMI